MTIREALVDAAVRSGSAEKALSFMKKSKRVERKQKYEQLKVRRDRRGNLR